jgi:DNA polymerase type B, organellar and viral
VTALPPLTGGRWKRTREYVPDAAAIYKVRGEIKGRCPYGVFMDVSGTGFFREGHFDTWVTGWELAAAEDEVVLQDVDDGYVRYPAPDATNPLADYVEFFFQKKRETPNTDPRYEMYKFLLNSLYGKFIQLTDEIDTDLGTPLRVGGGLFNPFWAGQITGHCRARLHELEHHCRALHSSTDSILTRVREIPTGSALGNLEVRPRAVS